MLQQMRKFAKSWVSSLFLGALALSFAVWGIADVFRGSTDTTAFAIGSVQTPVEVFARDYHNAVRNAGAVLSPDQAKALGQQVLDRMMLTTALDNLVDRLGLTVSDARVRAMVQSNPAFNGPLGTFDHNTFLAILGRYGYSEDEFIAVSRKDAARGQMLRATEGGFQIPPDYARAIYGYVNELRAADYILVNADAVGTIAPPSEAVLAAYVKAHPDRFSTPEYRTVAIAAVSADDVAAKIAVTDKQIDDELAAHRSSYVTPETRELEQINFTGEADAKAARAALDGGKTFDALAADRKLKDTDYKLGELTQSDLSIDPARAKAAFGLAEGATTDPIKTAFGWALMHVVKITPGSAKSRDEIKAVVQHQLALDAMTKIANDYTDAVGGGAPIDEAARKAGMRYVRVAAADAQGLAPDGSKVPALADPDLLAAVFKAEVGEDGDPFQTPNGNYYAIRVDGVTPPKVKPLDAVRAQATSRWIAEQKLVQLHDKALALAAKANEDHSLAGVAASLGAPVQTSPALARTAAAGLFNAAVIRALFDAPPGGAVAVSDAGGYLIARVSGIKHPLPPENDLNYMRVVRGLSNEVASDTTIGLAKAEQAREGTSVNQKLIDTTIGGSPGTGS